MDQIQISVIRLPQSSILLCRTLSSYPFDSNKFTFATLIRTKSVKHLMSYQLSVISRFATKSYCVSEMILGSIRFSLVDKTLDIILYLTLQRLIGQNSVIETGMSVFGIKHMLV